VRPATEPALARPLHAAAWWLWALGMAGAASRTTNPLVLGLILAVVGVVVTARRTDAPWASSFGVFLRLALVVIVIRTAFHIVLGGVQGQTVLVTLPEVRLPEWAQGIRLGGEVTAEGLVGTLYDGLRLGVLLACVGAANALANPKRMLRSLPAALYEVSVAVVVAMSAVPQLVTSTRQVRRARALRGDTARGWRAIRSVLVPVLEDALDRSITLAASMDARGYGRRAGVPTRARHITSALVLAGLGGICLGTFGILDTTADGVVGAPALLAGIALAVAGLVTGSRRVVRTRYRPDRWRAQEVVVVVSGMAALASLLAAEALAVPGLVPPVSPLGFPQLPWLPALGVLAGLLPAVAAPRPARPAPGPVPARQPSTAPVPEPDATDRPAPAEVVGS
jgi:energy-coupling factor transport system permease protein